MAKRSTPDSAYRHYQEPLREALGCIAPGRLSLVRTRRFEVGPVYTLAFNDGLPVTLKGETTLQLSVGQRFRIVDVTETGSEPFLVQVVDYWYEISSVERREIFAFHWTPEADPTVMKTTPHLHIGSVNIADTSPLNSKTFNKLHIPTGYVSVASVVRFLIEELQVEPRRANWTDILRDDTF